MTNETLFLNWWSHIFKWSGWEKVVILKNVVIGYEYSVFMFQFFLINYKPNSNTVCVDWSSNQLLSIGLCYPYICYLLTEIIHNFFAVHQAKSVQLIFITINIEIFNQNRPEKSEIRQANEIEIWKVCSKNGLSQLRNAGTSEDQVQYRKKSVACRKNQWTDLRC